MTSTAKFDQAVRNFLASVRPRERIETLALATTLLVQLDDPRPNRGGPRDHPRRSYGFGRRVVGRELTQGRSDRVTLAHLEDVANFVGAIASFGAAGLWFWASSVRLPPFPDVGFDSTSKVFDPVYDALKRTSRRNTFAAVMSGIAALAFAVAFYCREAQIGL